MESEVTRESLEAQFEELKLKLSNLKMIVEDYPVLQKDYEESDLGVLTDTVNQLQETSYQVGDDRLSQISLTLESITTTLEESDIIKQAGMEYLKDYELYNAGDGLKPSPELEEEIQSLDKIRLEQESKIKILKQEIDKLSVNNEELEAEIEKIKNETSEEQKEYEIAKQKKGT